jgi:flagellar FliJ protein
MFKFDLQHVLDYRVSLEEKCQVSYSDQLRCVENERRVLDAIKARKEILMEQFLNVQNTEMNAADIGMYISYMKQMIAKEEEQTAILSGAEAVLEEKRVLLLEAVKNRKAMENLKEKKLQQFRSGTLEKERKELDEFGIVKYQGKVEDEEGDRSL